MSTERTPALDRATEALNYVFDEEPRTTLADLDEPTRLLLAEGARAAVSAALHDPDDPDFGARELYVADSGQDRDFALRIWFQASDDQPVKQHYRRMFDDVRAAILGEA